MSQKGSASSHPGSANGSMSKADGAAKMSAKDLYGPVFIFVPTESSFPLKSPLNCCLIELSDLTVEEFTKLAEARTKKESG
uniref:Uncharacterized protein n=1 Tax=Sphaerodactylus townsendi TaxID=933632 RepID=A0ACB8G2U3_9SAUR